MRSPAFKIFCNRRNRRKRAMTLFELLVVVLIAVILVALATFSTRSLVVNTRVSAVKEDQRLMSRAMQNYALDFSEFPAPANGLESLATSYMPNLPHDGFQRQNHRFLYVKLPGNSSARAVLISPGPDGAFDLPEELWQYANASEVNPRLLPNLEPVAPQFGAYSGSDDDVVVNSGDVEEEDERPVAHPSNQQQDILEELLLEYLRTKQYNPVNGESGDIITVVQ